MLALIRRVLSLVFSPVRYCGSRALSSSGNRLNQRDVFHIDNNDIWANPTGLVVGDERQFASIRSNREVMGSIRSVGGSGVPISGVSNLGQCEHGL